MATTLQRTQHIVTLYAHCLSCLLSFFEVFALSVSFSTAVVELQTETDETAREESLIMFEFSVIVSTGRVLSFLSRPKRRSGALLSNVSPVFV